MLGGTIPVDVEDIFEYWKLRFGKKRSKLDAKRRRLIEARFKDGYSVLDLREACDGCALSEFHNGNNERHTSYNDIALICRDAEHLDKFIEINEKAKSKAKIQAQYRERLRA